MTLGAPTRYTAHPLSGEATWSLAEGVLWDARAGRLRWVDIETGTVLSAPFDGTTLGPVAAAQVSLAGVPTAGAQAHAARVEAARTALEPTASAGAGEPRHLADAALPPHKIGAIGLGDDGRLVAAVDSSLVLIDPPESLDPREAQALASGFLLAAPGRRLNDGVCDPAGGFIVGALSDASGTGAAEELVVRVVADGLDGAGGPGSVTVLRDDIEQSNGMGFSPDGRTFYLIDTVPGRIWAADFDATGDRGAAGDAGSLPTTDWRVAFTLPGEYPDGMRVDDEGMLWIAVWGAGEVRRYRPDGELLAVVEVDAPFTTCVAFAGPDRRSLVITTSNRDHTAAERLARPHAGGLFVARIDVAGPEPYRFG
ncbi:SMP-30/gluconolactonase/LRE family protein [Herbiconiux sp. 11R-BC]|uniref:SMP-30/gluconolactonase/LRE family protein n=1 Tax=Herbiconiux sp. 11R-BC TaxID=3111637 RepID=UPI003BFC5841